MFPDSTIRTCEDSVTREVYQQEINGIGGYQ